MKKQLALLIVLLLIGVQAQAQTTHIVDINDNGIGDFSSLSAAISAASSGDILLLVPSEKSYGNLSLTSTGKKLTIAGGGANGATGLYTKLGTISLNGGSANNTNLDGFVLGGFLCESIDINFVDSIKIKAVRTTAVISSTNYQLRVRSSVGAEIEFVATEHAFFSATSGLKIYHTMFKMNPNTTLVEIQTSNQFIISNSIFQNFSKNQDMILIDESSIGLVTNNVFHTDIQVFQSVNFGGAVSVINNIFVHPNYGNYTVKVTGGQSYQNNIFYSNYGAQYVTNTTSVGLLTLANDGSPDAFQNKHVNPTLNYTTYRLIDGSPGIDYGSGNDIDGTQSDLGVFGGLDPIPQLLPNAAVGVSVVPSVTSLTLSLPTAVSGGKVILNVSGQSKKN